MEKTQQLLGKYLYLNFKFIIDISLVFFLELKFVDYGEIKS